MSVSDGAGVRPGTTPWQDMIFLEELGREMRQPSAPDRDGADMIDLGFKPRPPGDPGWLVWATVVGCVMAALSIPLIIMLHMK